MKLFTKLVCMLLIVVLVFPTVACATEEVEPRASSYFTKHGAYVERMSSTRIDIWFEVTAVRTMDVLGAETVKLQRSSDGDSWETIKTYSMDDYDQMTDTNCAGHSCCLTYNSATAGYYYRARIDFYAKKDTGSASYTMYTSSIT